jgi:hypothetical protein
MMLVYLDEAGIGDLKTDKFVVMTGVVVLEKQWNEAVVGIQKIVDKYIHPLARPIHIFHAKELFHGTGRMPKTMYTKEERWNCLEELCALIPKVSVSLLAIKVDREKTKASMARDVEKHGEVVASQMAAMSAMIWQTERFVRAFTPDRHAIMIFENNDQCKKAFGHIVWMLRNPVSAEVLSDIAYSSLLPLKGIIDTAHFVEKRGAPLLQLADVCAFVLRRKWLEKPDADRFYDYIKGHRWQFPGPYPIEGIDFEKGMGS